MEIEKKGEKGGRRRRRVSYIIDKENTRFQILKKGFPIEKLVDRR